MLDFMVMEAVHVKVKAEDAKAQKDAELEARRQKFRSTKDPANFENLNQHR